MWSPPKSGGGQKRSDPKERKARAFEEEVSEQEKIINQSVPPAQSVQRNLAPDFDLIELKRKNAVKLKSATDLRKSLLPGQEALASILDEEIKACREATRSTRAPAQAREEVVHALAEAKVKHTRAVAHHTTASERMQSAAEELSSAKKDLEDFVAKS